MFTFKYLAAQMCIHIKLFCPPSRLKLPVLPRFLATGARPIFPG
jgi:hypothetical protein